MRLEKNVSFDVGSPAPGRHNPEKKSLMRFQVAS